MASVFSSLPQAMSWWWDKRTFKDSTHVFICEQDGGFCREQYGKPFKERMQLMKRLCERAQVKPFGFHAIRHLTASILYKMGQPVSVIQAILRHKSPNTTAVYLRTLGLEETRGALEGLAARLAGHGLEPDPAGNGCGKVLPFNVKAGAQEKMPASPTQVVIRRKRTA